MKSIHFNLTISSFYFSCGRNRRVWSLITINPIDIPFNESVFRSLLFPHKKNETILRSVFSKPVERVKDPWKAENWMRARAKSKTRPKTCIFDQKLAPFAQHKKRANDIKCMKGCGRQFLYQRWHLECIQLFRADCIWSSLLQWFRFVFSFLWIIYCAACIEVEIKHTHDDLVNVQILINLYFSLSRQTKYRNSVFTYFFCSLLERAMRHSSCFL